MLIFFVNRKKRAVLDDLKTIFGFKLIKSKLLCAIVFYVIISRCSSDDGTVRISFDMREYIIPDDMVCVTESSDRFYVLNNITPKP